MPYSVIQPGMFDGLDEDCMFSIPALNDNIRKMDILQSSVAIFPTTATFRPGDAVYAFPGASRWEARNAPTGWGCLGAAIGPTLANGTVRVQLIGQAMLRSAVSASTGNIGRYLVAGGNIYTGPVTSGKVIGKITGVIDAWHYEVLLHALPSDVYGVHHASGVGWVAAAGKPLAGASSCSFSVREAFIRWYDDAGGKGHGKDNYFEVIGYNDLITGFPTYSGDKAYATINGNFLGGSAKIDTYNHASYDHVPAYLVTDIRPEVSGTNITFHLRSQQSQNWATIYEFDAHVQVAGWWA